ncbi:MAG: hypothetical protein RL139_1281, partial [Gemmatimonadota bacterium]
AIAQAEEFARLYREARARIGELESLLELRPAGHVGPERIPWFQHCGISHAAGAECVVCALLARSALEASAVPSEPYMNDYVLDERNRPASAVPSETWGERHHQWHSGGDCGCSWAETLDRRTLPASAVPSEPMPGRRGPDHGPGCDCMAHDLPASAVPSETRDRDYGHRPTRTWPGLTLNGRVVCAADAMKWPCPSYRALHGFERGR